ncbi:hypothetical protein [Nesterenkonia suensis]
MRTPLMRRVVFGRDAAEGARLCDVSEATMAQRLVRTKRRVRDVGIPFHIPTREGMPARLAAVLEAIYGAYASDWLDQCDAVRESLADEAWGLAALLTFPQSRAPARVSKPWPPIQSAHCDRKRTGRLDTGRLLQLYDGLIAVAPHTGGGHRSRRCAGRRGVRRRTRRAAVPPAVVSSRGPASSSCRGVPRISGGGP